MSLHPTPLTFSKVGFILFTIVIFLFSCSRDTDLLLDSVLEDNPEEVVTLEESNEPQSVLIEEEPEEEIIEPEIILESRTTAFPSIQDAHTQSGKGFNQQIVRLEEGNRTSYLMFDLTPIADIKATITEVELQFTIVTDKGNGVVNVFKGDSNDWSEASLTLDTTPDTEVLLGSVTKEYEIGSIESIVLNEEEMNEEVKTLILSHENGDDLSFASKEHPTVDGPKLVVTYNTPPDAPEIIIEEEEEEPIVVTENESPIAVADATPQSGQAPLQVNFKGDNSSDDKGIKNYSWKLMDGVTRTNPNPSFTFQEIGTYDVELTVTDEEGLTDIDIITINVTEEENLKPTARASASPLSGEAPLEVKFTGDKSEDDINISSFRWRFAQGEISNEVNPSFTFTEAGTYPVSLTVKDENGLEDRANLTITVSKPKNEAPKAVLGRNKSSGEAPLTVRFNASNSTDDKEIKSYLWNFGINQPATSNVVERTFTQPGDYTVRLTVKDEEGLSHTASTTIRVNEPAVQNQAPIARGVPSVTSGEAPLTVNFKGEQSTDDDEIVSYAWNFKDGSTSNNVNPTHTFDSPGTYRVELTVTDSDGAKNTDTDTITVTESNSNNGGNGNHPPNAVFASSFGFRAGDATEAFQDAIRSNHSYIVIDKQSTDWVIQPSRFFDITDKTIVFESGVVLRAKSGAYSSPSAILVDFRNARNLTIKGYGATFKMNRGEYGKSEYRHALKIDGGKNIEVKGLRIIDSGGDGIIIQRGSGNYAEDVTIEDVVSHNNMRQGLSIISGKNIFVKNCTFSKSNGANPESGLDLEPDFPSDRLQNINITNCTFKNNNYAGIMVGVPKLNSSSFPLSINVSDCVFSNNAQRDNHPYELTEIRLSSGENGANTVKGSVNFTRITFDGSLGRIIQSPKASTGYSVTFKDCVGRNLVTRRNEHPILLEGRLDSPNIGGFSFQNFRLQYNRNKSFMYIRLPDNKEIRNITGSFIIDEPYDNGIRYLNSTPSNRFNVNINYTHID